MKIQVRRTEYRYIAEATPIVTLDTDKFPNFKGTTDEEFVHYLAENYWDLEGIDEIIGNSIGVNDEKTLTALADLVYSDMDVYSDSSNKGYEGEIQIGEEDESYTKHGGFNIKHGSQI
tara:strand:- start:3193 stop:3546 length:354 start_codon:yes stop_codon:yes gene_type:complete